MCFQFKKGTLFKDRKVHVCKEGDLLIGHWLLIYKLRTLFPKTSYEYLSIILLVWRDYRLGGFSLGSICFISGDGGSDGDLLHLGRKSLDLFSSRNFDVLNAFH